MQAMLRVKFIAIKITLKRSQINNLNLHLKELEKEQTKSKTSRRKEIKETIEEK